MAYFRELPDFEYISRLNDANSSSDYVKVKNIFRRGKMREDIFNDYTFFTEYIIIGNERPDNVAEKIYGDPELDWVILYANNIVSVRDEWPLTNVQFKNFLIDKYGTIEKAESVKLYRSKEVRDTLDNIILPAGLEIDKDYSITYRDPGLGTEVIATDISIPITFTDYEDEIQDRLRNINVIKSNYLGLVISNMEEEMTYVKSSQYINDTLKRADNIKIKGG